MISSLESIYQKMTSANGLDAANPPGEPVPRGQIGGDVAHELNNVITIIRGYAERMMLRHGENPALRQDLQLITDNARRAEKVVRAASQASRRQPMLTNSLALR
jgi:signal transduction histidine kinase